MRVRDDGRGCWGRADMYAPSLFYFIFLFYQVRTELILFYFFYFIKYAPSLFFFLFCFIKHAPSLFYFIFFYFISTHRAYFILFFSILSVRTELILFYFSRADRRLPRSRRVWTAAGLGGLQAEPVRSSGCFGCFVFRPFLLHRYCRCPLRLRRRCARPARPRLPPLSGPRSAAGDAGAGERAASAFACLRERPARSPEFERLSSTGNPAPRGPQSRPDGDLSAVPASTARRTVSPREAMLAPPSGPTARATAPFRKTAHIRQCSHHVHIRRAGSAGGSPPSTAASGSRERRLAARTRCRRSASVGSRSQYPCERKPDGPDGSVAGSGRRADCGDVGDVGRAADGGLRRCRTHQRARARKGRTSYSSRTSSHVDPNPSSSPPHMSRAHCRRRCSLAFAAGGPTGGRKCGPEAWGGLPSNGSG